MRSLQARLAVGLVVTVLVLFTAQWLVVNVSLRKLTEEYFASRLTHDAEGLLAGIVFDPEHHPVVAVDRADPIFQRPFSGHYYEVMSEGYIVRSRSLLDHSLDVKPVEAGRYTLTRTHGPERQPLIMLVAGYEKRGRLLTIAVAEDYSPIEGEFGVFQWRYVLITGAVLIGLIVLQMWVVKRGLRPLEQVRADVRRLEQGEIQELTGKVPSEVVPLVVEINHLITIIGDRLKRSRNALGNLAHALKTPLTALDQLLNSAELGAHPQLQAQLRDQSGMIGSFIQRELKRARLAGAPTPGGRFDLRQELPSLLSALKQIYRDKQLALEWTIPPGFTYLAEREDMLELFGNLLDNACKWAAGRVLFTVMPGPGLSFRIEDDGPGAPEEKLEQLSARGVRLDESVGGYGLGLSIAREIVNYYRGEMSFDRSPQLGGFRVSVHLPDLSGSS
ncbi:MAG: ATP-binding protein [Gammaproteobacteria bacterium]|jgi:signal transduction histidine kinase